MSVGVAHSIEVGRGTLLEQLGILLNSKIHGQVCIAHDHYERGQEEREREREREREVTEGPATISSLTP